MYPPPRHLFSPHVAFSFQTLSRSIHIVYGALSYFKLVLSPSSCSRHGGFIHMMLWHVVDVK